MAQMNLPQSHRATEKDRQGDKGSGRQGERKTKRKFSLSPCLLVSLSPCLLVCGVCGVSVAKTTSRCASTSTSLRPSSKASSTGFFQCAARVGPGGGPDVRVRAAS